MADVEGVCDCGAPLGYICGKPSCPRVVASVAAITAALLPIMKEVSMSDEFISAELTRRGAKVVDDSFWEVTLSDGTTAQISFGDDAKFGPLDEWDWYVAHCDAKGEEIGGGNWDFAGALESLDGYIKAPGWDRGDGEP